MVEKKEKESLLEAGGKFGAYTVEKPLGRSSTGEVYLVKDGFGLEFALKAMRPPEGGDRQEWYDRFLREAEFVKRIRHPNVVTIHEAGVDGERGLCYIVMEYVAGGSLADKLHGGVMNVPDALSVVSQISSALAVAHGVGVVHRGITPSNILIDESGKVKLTDLYVSRLFDEEGENCASTSGVASGTLTYKAPEQLSGSGAVDGRADIYSLGLIFYEMLAGTRPYATSGDGEEHPNIRTVRPDVPPPLAHVIATMVALKPELRPESAEAVMRLVRALGDGRAKAVAPHESHAGVAAAGAHAPSEEKAGGVQDGCERTAQRARRGHGVRSKRIVMTVCAIAVAAGICVAIFSSHHDHGVGGVGVGGVGVVGELRDEVVVEQRADSMLRSANANGLSWTFLLKDGKAVLQGPKSRWQKIGDAEVDDLQAYERCVTPLPEGELKVPSEIDGFKVAGIGEYAFCDCKGMTGVVLPEGLEEIQQSAFLNCTGLTSLKFPASLRIVERLAFSNCVRLRRIDVASCEYIDASAFMGDIFVKSFAASDQNSEYKSEGGALYSKDGRILFFFPMVDETARVPDGTEEVNSYALGFASEAKTLIFPKSVNTLRKQLEIHGDKLESIIFEGDAPECGLNFFSSNPRQIAIYVSPDSRGWRRQGGEASGIPDRWPESNVPSHSCEIRYMGETPKDAARRRAEDKATASGTLMAAQIGAHTWRYIVEDGEVVLKPEKRASGIKPCVTPMPQGALDIPARIGGKMVAIIDAYAFSGCEGMTSVEIPEGVRAIRGEGAFKGCTSLEKVVFPESMQSVRRRAFEGCDRLRRVDIARCTDITGEAFVGCESLEQIDAAADNPVYRSVDGALYSHAGGRLSIVAYPKTKSTLKMIAGVREIGKYAFTHCRRLKEANIPEGVEMLLPGAFEGCSQLEKVVLPRSLSTLWWSPFAHTPRLSSVAFHGNAPSLQDADAEGAENGEGDFTVFVAHSSTGWDAENPAAIPEVWPRRRLAAPHRVQVFDEAMEASMRQGASEDVADSPDSEGVVHVAKIGKYSWSYTLENGKAILWCGSDEKVGSPCISPRPSGRVVVPAAVDGHAVVALGSLAFFQCDEIDEIVLPKTLERIGNRAFMYCKWLRSISLPDKVSSIGLWAFNNCRSLNSVNLNNCEHLARGNGVFAFCPQIERFTVSNGNKEFEARNGVLYSRDGKTLVAVPPKSYHVQIAQTIETIGAFAFWGCHEKSLTMPATIRKIQEGAFMDCTNLTRLTFEGDAPEVEDVDINIFHNTPRTMRIKVAPDSKGWGGEDSDALPKTWPTHYEEPNCRAIGYADK